MGTLHKQLRPPSQDAKILAESAKIYGRGNTPEVSENGVISELDVRPGGPALAAKHLREIHRNSDASGAVRAVHGLQVTRGNQFVLDVMNFDRGLNDLLGTAQTASSDPVRAALNSNVTGRPVAAEHRMQFARSTGHDPSSVRVFDDNVAHEAAAAVNARAFTVGQRVFFNRGEYDPGRDSGRELLMHELAHTVQQRDAGVIPPSQLAMSQPGDRFEREADSVAQSVVRQNSKGANDGNENEEGPLAGRDGSHFASSPTLLVQRAITFTTTNHAPTKNTVVGNEDAGGFHVQAPDPTFQWQPDVTIHGNPGDPFAEWETAHHQVVKSFGTNVVWGTGANRTRRQVTITGGFPIRDATAAGNTWYSDFRAQAFAADGEVESPIMHDRPNTGFIPYANPIAARAGNSGSFNHAFGFVTTLSARHTPDGTGARAFRHLNHMHWNFSVNGTFDGAAAAGARVASNGGVVNNSGMFSGFDPDNPPMHGGPIANDHFNTVDT